MIAFVKFPMYAVIIHDFVSWKWNFIIYSLISSVILFMYLHIVHGNVVCAFVINRMYSLSTGDFAYDMDSVSICMQYSPSLHNSLWNYHSLHWNITNKDFSNTGCLCLGPTVEMPASSSHYYLCRMKLVWEMPSWTRFSPLLHICHTWLVLEITKVLSEWFPYIMFFHVFYCTRSHLFNILLWFLPCLLFQQLLQLQEQIHNA